MRVFETKEFCRTARKLRVNDAMLRAVVREIEAGYIDAALGSQIIKQRVARSGSGKSGGLRTLIAFRLGHRCVFVDVFAKNEEANISALDLKDLRRAAKVLLGLNDAAVEKLLCEGRWVELEMIE